MADFTPGYTFQTADLVTAQKLNDLIANAEPSNLDRTDFSATSRIVTVGATAPSAPQTGEPWYSTAEAQPLWYTGTSFRAADELLLTATVGMNAGYVAVFDSANDLSATTTTTVGDIRWAGVVREDVNATDECRLARTGIVPVMTDGNGVARGEYLKASGTAGQATAVATADPGAFAVALVDQAAGSPALITAALLGRVIDNPNVVAPAQDFTLKGSFVAPLNAGGFTAPQNAWTDYPGVASADMTGAYDAFEVTFSTTSDNQFVLVHAGNIHVYTDEPVTNLALRLVLNDASFGSGLADDSSYTNEFSSVLSLPVGGDNGVSIINTCVPLIVPTTNASNSVKLQYYLTGATNIAAINQGYIRVYG